LKWWGQEEHWDTDVRAPWFSSDDVRDAQRCKGYLRPELREKWVRMVGFRNTLVHEYIDIDRKIVYETLPHGVEDLSELRRVFARFL
jgi:uncharacterized protein YutE (UPF0331/DUF86 family)